MKYLLYSSLLLGIAAKLGVSMTFLDAPDLDFECGRSNTIVASDFAKRVTGSVISEPSAWPWMALLGELKRASVGGSTRLKKVWFCGGVLISDRWVLTAAHCLDRPTFFVRLGEHNVDETPDGVSLPEDYDVALFMTHPSYLAPYNYFDLALIKLSEVVVFTNTIRPICLPWDADREIDPVWVNRKITHRRSKDNFSNLEGRDVYISGWGATQYGGASSPVLREGIVQIKNTELCQKNYTEYNPGLFKREWPRGITDRILCAGDEFGTDTCQGDSGGPLSLRDSSNRFVVVGIVSTGIGCGKANLPGLYVSVIPELLWIRTEAFVDDCKVDTDCLQVEICFGNICTDPCQDRTCGRGAICKKVNREAECSCPDGFTGNPFSSCTVSLSATANNPCLPNPCAKDATCQFTTLKNGEDHWFCSCKEEYDGNPYESCSPSNADVVETPVQAIPDSCKGLFTNIGTGCIFVDKSIHLDWELSRNYCRNKGSDLVTFRDRIEFSAVVEYLKKIDAINVGLNYGGFWSGGNDLLRENNWVWLDHDSAIPTGSSYWGIANGVKEPSGGRHENCAYFYPSDHFLLHDLPCEPSKLFFLISQFIKVSPVCYYSH